MSEQAKCGLCGEPMPEGEEMFNYHGYSGPCPKPPVGHKGNNLDTNNARLVSQRSVDSDDQQPLGHDNVVPVKSAPPVETPTQAWDEEHVERLARFIAQKESRNCKTLDEALHHQSKWQRIVPEAREMLEAAFHDR